MLHAWVDGKFPTLLTHLKMHHGEKQMKNELPNTAELKKKSISKNTVVSSLLIVSLFLPTLGFCDDSQGLNAMTDSVINTIFSPWVRRSILAFGAGLGIFQSIAGGTWKPLMVWGGLGLTVNYIPKIINLLAN